ncbi:MAG: NUDIX hydrolase [Candidatus Pacebacteria bacterium]|nr:NUDIX hydrolase [Candidatus Paceibacterota bacterium]
MKKTKFIPKKEFDKIYSRVPRLCVEVCIVSKDGIVLTKRAIEPANGKWHLPGGTVRYKERLTDTVKRIALEETNLKVKPEKILGIIEYPNFDGYKGHPVSICFLVSIKGGKLKYNGDATDIQFFKKMPRSIIKEHRDFIVANIKL